MLLEVVGGVLSGSLALLADAGHICPTCGGPSLCALLAVPVLRRPPAIPPRTAAKTHPGGLCECHCVGGHYPSHCLGSDRALYTPRPLAGNLMMVIAVAGSAGEPVCVLDSPSGSDEKPERALPRATCDGKILLGSVGATVARVDHYLWTGWTPADDYLF